MHFDFELIPDDLRELARVTRKLARVARKNPVHKLPTQAGRGLAGWFLVIAVAIGLICLVKSHTPRVRNSPASMHGSDSWWSIAVPLAPVMIVVLLFVYVMIRLRFPSDAVLLRKLEKQKIVSMDIEQIGVRSASGASETLWKWDAFDKLIETDSRFFLRLTNSLGFVVIPKRAIGDVAATNELRHILESHVQV